MSLPKVKGLTTEQSEAMVRLSRLPAFKDLVAKVEADEVSGAGLLTLTEPWHTEVLRACLIINHILGLNRN